MNLSYLPVAEGEGLSIVIPVSEEPNKQRLNRSASHSGSADRFKRSRDTAKRERRRKRDSKHVLKWNKGKVIGQGGFGTVYLGLDVNSGQFVAGKEFNFDVREEKQVQLLNVLEKEISTMRDLSHPNIVKYIGADRVENCFYIFMEYVPGGSLRSLLDEFGALQPRVISNFTRQIVLGLQYLHQHQVIHRDIKAANVLVNVDGVVKLADFGSAQTFSEGRGMHGTPYWMAPEVIRDEAVGWQSDIWSLGCVVVEMFTGLRPFAQFDNPAKALGFIMSSNDPVPLPEQCTERAEQDFLNACFARDPSLRPSATSLLTHPFLSSLGDHSNLASFSASDRVFSVSAGTMGQNQEDGIPAGGSALAEEMRSALASRAMSQTTMNPLRTSTTGGTALEIAPTAAQDECGEHVLVEAVLEHDGDSEDMMDEFEEVQPEAEAVDDEFCTNQRKAQIAVLVVLLIALAIISTLLGLKS